ncbi:MAG: hypothetical protein V3V15_10305 [Sphingorhabdus sp.]
MRLMVIMIAAALAIAGALPLAALAPNEGKEPAAAPADTLLDRVSGRWVAQGNSFGPETVSELDWAKTLDGRFYRIDYRIQTAGNGRIIFAGTGHYRATKAKATSGYWADSGGELHPLSVRFTDDRIETIWGRADGKMGRTHYALESGDTAMRVTDWLLSPEGWRQFNTALFTRRAP